MVCLCNWQLFWTLFISWFLTFANANMHNFTFFPPKLHAPCTKVQILLLFRDWIQLYGFVQFKFVGFLHMLFQLHFMIVLVTLASFSYFNISKLCVFAFCFNFYLFFVFHFEFYVVVNVLFGITVYGHLIAQHGLLHHLFGLLESLVSLTFSLPLIFLSMFQYLC